MKQLYHLLQKLFKQTSYSSALYSANITLGMCLFIAPLHTMNSHKVKHSLNSTEKQKQREVKAKIIAQKIEAMLNNITNQSFMLLSYKNKSKFDEYYKKLNNDENNNIYHSAILAKINQSVNASISLESIEVIKSEILSSKSGLYYLFLNCNKYGIEIKDLKKYCNQLIQQIVKKHTNIDKEFMDLFYNTDCNLENFDSKLYKKELEKLDNFRNNIISKIKTNKLNQEHQKRMDCLYAGVALPSSFAIPYFNKYFNISSEISLKNRLFRPFLGSHALYTLFLTCNRYKIFIQDINDHTSPLLEKIYTKYHKAKPMDQELAEDLRMLLFNTDFNPDAKGYYTFGQDKDQVEYFHTAFYLLSVR